jgi:pyridoxal phosphate enzyme (YggS family)
MFQNKINIVKSKIENSLKNSKSPLTLGDITLIAVSKTKPTEDIAEVIKCGIFDLGENKVQEALEKAEYFLNHQPTIKWHLIGPVQTNKVKYLSKFCHLLHSLDRLELAEAIQKRMEFENKKIDVLIQVNTSFEDTKSGIEPEKAIELIKQISNFDRIKIKGLMTIGKNTDNMSEVRDCFKNLKELFEEAKNLNLANVTMQHLSMGMSSDYEIAIEEGANMLRVGSSIFGER